ncbi:MAG: aspartate aminotransferase family protein [Planctomycetota bacterium]|nr:aspartate aminotransferase family protein [Planctomycetota bacterium]MEC9156972.1 aspartate aminotransferase family protein [Planctomycetota bacterium]MEC9234401.1 aspartate aminotransferase family protein [Planctomycetota bacterium]
MSIQTEQAASQSAELFARAQRVLPGGVSRNTVLRKPHPAYAARGEGCRITDLDGTTRIDFSNNMASLIHGHAYPPIVRAVTEQLERGTAYMMATESEVAFAEHLCSRSPGFEKIRFVNSGTEAIMVGIKAARAFTGRPRIAKIEGAYHGGYDYAEVSQTPKPENWGSAERPNTVPLVHGTPDSSLDNVVILPFNDVDMALALLDEHREEIAGVVLDPMPHRVGLNPVEPGFMRAIRDWTTANGSLLVLDEVITFRSEYGGLQSHYGIQADLTAMGKMIGGGFPVGAVAGRADVMDVMDPNGDRYLFPHSGTFSANPISMVAGHVAMLDFDETAVARINALSERARTGITEAARATGARACVTGAGSILRVHMKETPPRNFREAYLSPEEGARLSALLDHLFEAGFIMINTCTAMMSTPMTEVEIDALVAGCGDGFEKIARMP